MLAFLFIPAMCCFSSELILKLNRRPIYLIALFTLCAAFHEGKIVFLVSVFLVLVYCGHLAAVVTNPCVRKTCRYKVKCIDIKPISAQNSFVHKAKAELERQRSLKKAKSLQNLANSALLLQLGKMDQIHLDQNVPILQMHYLEILQLNLLLGIEKHMVRWL